ncbi:MAG: 30S ribosomal protein S17 [Erysipelotrichia bacterium]|jgi:small subunit ribosomal protein S17|nr:30S ribosomal protein S17 [Erysipelotrichia bacterium]
MNERVKRPTYSGKVVSDKMDKTIVVLVSTYKKHKMYKKRVKYDKKYYAHDELNEAKMGDQVTIMGCRPLSALKRYRLVSVDVRSIETIKAEEIEAALIEQETVEEVVVEQPVLEEVVEQETVEKEVAEEKVPTVEVEVKDETEETSEPSEEVKEVE